ncbi:MAG: hypothetical protein WDM77_10565 [Steroidobacteraceae bacterium]
MAALSEKDPALSALGARIRGADRSRGRCKARNWMIHTNGVPRPAFLVAYSLPQHWKIVQTAQLLLLLHEFGASYRQIFLDGRPLPVDPQPGWNGYSTDIGKKTPWSFKTAVFATESGWTSLAVH